ncbi:hypothetical protein NDU88_004575 [Pleurodeles waltl]|uniref:Uncharacterized protein n=1 Tax=Pleurodeles waltl TaxID=8319 RepID=A0AAV7VL63_PLEWA|nr:hypothetical protein NDU88_004575 [Pleurodeles waltl]
MQHTEAIIWGNDFKVTLDDGMEHSDAAQTLLTIIQDNYIWKHTHTITGQLPPCIRMVGLLGYDKDTLAGDCRLVAILLAKHMVAMNCCQNPFLP